MLTSDAFLAFKIVIKINFVLRKHQCIIFHTFSFNITTIMGNQHALVTLVVLVCQPNVANDYTSLNVCHTCGTHLYKQNLLQ